MAFIQKEKNRVIKQVESFQLLLDRINKERYRIPHLDNYKDLILTVKNSLTNNLQTRINLMLEGIPEREQSKQLADLRYKIKRLFDIMYGFLINSLEVPRELFYLSDLFLDYHKVKTRYIISISDEIALWTFSNLLRELGFQETFPEFWKDMKNVPFYVVQVVSEVADENMSLDWPIVMHELAHMICTEKNTENEYFNKISILEALRTIGAVRYGIEFPIGRLVELATKKLYCAEFIADIIVTRCFGAFYGWRFLKGWFSFKDIFETDRYHPPSDKRLEKIALEVENGLGITEDAEFLKKEIAKYKTHSEVLEEYGRLNDPEINGVLSDVDSVLMKIFPKIRKYSNFNLSSETIEQVIQDSPWMRMVKKKEKNDNKKKIVDSVAFLKLRDEFLKGIPIILDPPVLYYIISRNFSDSKKLKELDLEDAELIRTLLADSIRLYAVQRQYLNS